MDVLGFLFLGLPLLLSPFAIFGLILWIWASYLEGEHKRSAKVMSSRHQKEIVASLGAHVSIEEIESTHARGGRPFGERYGEWKEFVSRIEPKEELRQFLVLKVHDFPEWDQHRSGYARVRGIRVLGVFFVSTKCA